eukprot:TRINITY_DN15080_c0_g1_i1.p1 TRINITY_DN15080_c0_g1~~TRINITY_DN15080_c0_g1_i1.p1  ORF type:complete len:2088 (-),score=225.01 TRINITY_DN15080_c0_g1_i1:17-6280(-)
MSRWLSWRLSLIFCLLNIFAPAALGQIYISPNGDDLYDGTSVSNAVFTLNRAIELSSSGGSILLVSGVYNWPTTQTISKPVLIRAENDVASVIITSSSLSSGSFISITAATGMVGLSNITIDLSSRIVPSVTLLSSASAIEISLYNISLKCSVSVDSCTPLSLSSATVKIQDFSLQGGGKSFFSNNGAGSFIRSSRFTQLRGSACGGLSIDSATNIFSIFDVEFTDSISTRGSALCLATNARVDLSGLTCRNLSGDLAVCILVSSGSVLTVSNSSFTDNVALYAGVAFAGGVISINNGASVNLSSCVFKRNAIASTASCLASFINSRVRVDSSTFEENSAVMDAATILAVDGRLTITNSVFDRNFLVGSASAQSRGTAINVDAGAMNPNLIAEVINCTFTSNYVDPSAGNFPSGAIYASRRPVLVDGCRFFNNSAYAGGAITMLSSPGFLIKNSTFMENEACFGGAIYTTAVDPAPLAATVENSLFIKNRAYECRTTVGEIYGGAFTFFGAFPVVNVSWNTFVDNHVDNSASVDRALGAAVLYTLYGPNNQLTSTGNNYSGHISSTGGFSSTLGYVVRIEAIAPVEVRIDFISDNFFNNSLLEVFPDGKLQPSLGGALGATSFSATATSNPIISITNCSFIQNFAATAPAYQLFNFHSIVRGSRIVNNTALQTAGSGTYIVDNPAVLWKNKISDSKFEGNLANLRDGSIFVIISDVLIQSDLCENGQAAAELTIDGSNLFLSYGDPDEYQYYHVGGINCTSVIFSPTEGDSVGANVTAPRTIGTDGAILDFRNVTATSKSIAILDLKNTLPSTVIIGEYDLTVGAAPSPFRSFQIKGCKGSCNSPGKLILRSVTEFNSRNAWKIENVDVVVGESGSMRIFGRYLDLNNSNILVEENGNLWFTRFDFSPLIRDVAEVPTPSSAIDIYGTFNLGSGFFDRVNVTLHSSSLMNYYITNFWPDSSVETTSRGGSFSVDGTLRFDFTFNKFFEPPTLDQRFVILNISSRVEAPLLGFTSKAGYLIEPDSMPADLSMKIKFFSPVEMRVTDDLSAVDVTFPLRTNAPPSRNCSSLLMQETLDDLPSNVECAWQSATVLRIRSVSVPRSIHFVPGAISDLRNSRFYATAAIGLSIQPPSNPLPPVAVITAPSVAPTCSSWALDASTSFRIGDIRNATFSWRLSSPTNAALQNLLGSTSSPRVEIPANILTASQSYMFSLNVTNTAGLSTEATWSVLATDQLLLADIEGPQTRTSFSYLPMILNGRVDIQNSCSVSDISVEQRWILPSTLTQANISVGAFSLEIPEYALEPNKNYTLEFSVWPRGSPQLSVRKSVTLVIVPAPISIRLSGDVGLVPLTRNVVSVASVVDPDGLLGGSDVRWAWTVVACDGYSDSSRTATAERISRFLQLSQGGQVDEVTSLSGVSCFNTTGALFLVRDLLAMNASSLTIPANTFGDEVLLGVTATSIGDDRVASKLLYLNFTRSGVTAIQTIGIDILGEQKGKILPQEKFVARASWNGQNTVPRNTSVRWGGSESDLSIDSSNLLTRVDLPALVLKEGSLIPSQFYSLTLSARNIITGDVVGSSRTFFQANSAPSSGHVEMVGGTQPQQQLRPFVVRALGWVDVDVPLLYVFSLKDPLTSQEIFLTELSDSPTATVVAPIPGSLLLRVRVFDRLGSMAVSDTPVVITPAFAQDVSTLQAALLSSFNRYVLWGDVRSATTYGVALAESFNSRNESATAVRQRIISSLAAVAEQRRLLWVNSPATINLLRAATQLGDFPLEAIENCTQILESVVAAAQSSAVGSSYSVSSSELARFSTAGFLRAAANTALGITRTAGVSGSVKVRLQRVVESIVLLQSRYVSVDELAAAIVTDTLRAATITVSNDTLTTSGGQIVISGVAVIASSWNSSNTFTVISWGSGVFPSAPNASSPVVQLLFEGAQVGNVSFGFSSSRPGGTCALFDASTEVWESKNCRTTQVGQQVVCECSPPSSASGKPILLSLLFADVPKSPEVLAATPRDFAEISSSSAGLIAGVIVAVLVALIVAGIVTVFAVPSLRAKLTPFANRHQPSSLTEDVELEPQPQGSTPPKWSVGSKPN